MKFVVGMSASGDTLRVMAEDLQRIRGTLPGSWLGARDLEHLSRNPSCDLQLTASAARVRMSDLAMHHRAITDKAILSPHAARHGREFEANALSSDAQVLVSAYVERGLLQEGANAKDCSVRRESGEATDAYYDRVDAATQECEAIIRARAAGDFSTPQVLMHARLTFDFNGPVSLEPDLLIAGEGERLYVPGDIKAFADLRGMTAASSLRAARRQVAVYVLALRRLYSALLEADDLDAYWAGDLVLSRGGSRALSVRREALRGEVGAIMDLLDAAPSRLRASAESMGSGTVDDLAALEHLKISFSAECASFCGMYRSCEARAHREGLPQVVDAVAGEQLASIGTIGRYAALMHDSGDASPDEAALIARMRRYDEKWEQTVA